MRVESVANGTWLSHALFCGVPNAHPRVGSRGSINSAATETVGKGQPGARKDRWFAREVQNPVLIRVESVTDGTWLSLALVVWRFKCPPMGW